MTSARLFPSSSPSSVDGVIAGAKKAATQTTTFVQVSGSLESSPVLVDRDRSERGHAAVELTPRPPAPFDSTRTPPPSPSDRQQE